MTISLLRVAPAKITFDALAVEFLWDHCRRHACKYRSPKFLAWEFSASSRRDGHPTARNLHTKGVLMGFHGEKQRYLS